MTGKFPSESLQNVHQKVSNVAQPCTQKKQPATARIASVLCVRRWLYVSSLLLVVGPIGCSELFKQPAPAKDLFSIEPGLPDASLRALPSTANATEPVLQVRSVRVSAPFDGAAFVYETAPSQYTLDYYNNFVASPSALLTESLLEWLEKAGPVRTVGAGTSVRSNLMLECEVTKLLIDFSDRAKPHAVIAARFLLYSNRTGAAVVLLDSSYEVSKPLTLNSPAGYSSAWGMALRGILQKLEADIRNALTRSGYPPE